MGRVTQGQERAGEFAEPHTFGGDAPAQPVPRHGRNKGNQGRRADPGEEADLQAQAKSQVHDGESWQEQPAQRGGKYGAEEEERGHEFKVIDEASQHRQQVVPLPQPRANGSHHIVELERVVNGRAIDAPLSAGFEQGTAHVHHGHLEEQCGTADGKMSVRRQGWRRTARRVGARVEDGVQRAARAQRQKEGPKEQHPQQGVPGLEQRRGTHVDGRQQDKRPKRGQPGAIPQQQGHQGHTGDEEERRLNGVVAAQQMQRDDRLAAVVFEGCLARKGPLVRVERAQVPRPDDEVDETQCGQDHAQEREGAQVDGEDVVKALPGHFKICSLAKVELNSVN